MNNGVIDLINGGLTNFHTTFINNGVVLTASSIQITNLSQSGNALNVSLLSTAGHTYQLQVSPAPAPAMWSNLGSTQPGNGSVLTFTDPGALTNQATRFYRLLVTAP